MHDETHDHSHHDKPHHEHVCGDKCKHKCGHKKCGHGHHTSQHSIGGGIWIIGWLFTIGYLHLSFWYGVLAIIVWPYFLGTHFAL